MSDVYVYLQDRDPQTYVARTVDDVIVCGIRTGLIVDFDVEGNPIGVEILDASRVEIDGNQVGGDGAGSPDLAATERALQRQLGDLPSTPPRPEDTR